MGSSRVVITVTGHAEHEYAPNRCTVHLRVAYDAGTKKSAASRAAAALDALTALIDALDQESESPLRRWSLDQVRHSRSRPYSNDGSVQPWRYQSSARLTATFRDLGASGLTALGKFTDGAAAIDGVTVSRLEWRLSRSARGKALARVRRLALREATAKADAYARGLGLKRTATIALADPGMLGRVPKPRRQWPGRGCWPRATPEMTGTGRTCGPSGFASPRTSMRASRQASAVRSGWDFADLPRPWLRQSPSNGPARGHLEE